MQKIKNTHDKRRERYLPDDTEQHAADSGLRDDVAEIPSAASVEIHWLVALQDESDF